MLSLLGKSDAEIGAGGCLADAAFLIGDSNYFAFISYILFTPLRKSLPRLCDRLCR